MSLVVALKAKDAIVMAADSRGTIGDPRGLTAINDKQQKLFPCGCCGLGLVGSMEMGTALLDVLENQARIQDVANVDDAARVVMQHSATSFGQWFGNIAPDKRPVVIITLAGYRDPRGAQPKPMVYNLNSQVNFAPQLFGDAPALSGVPQYAVYLVHRYYDPTIPTEKAKALAEYLIAETASQDPKVGGPIRMSMISAASGYAPLTEEEVLAVHKSNETLNARLREFFVTGGPQ
ncbi:hypothetical protein FJY68_04850 [candidate division WOR-3 bacterium]|uniref:Uncharacterized protein n=1 Tax=candidate division WOR-3 bacterium TaxID=2052148 RepID=A0A938BPG7_UNCW3|nr:hypothetical protein [candidate division WOR-3 bacterium]